MLEQPESPDAPLTLPVLKIVEPAVDKDEPWVDDVLSRQEIAGRLTNIVRGQEAPFVISVDGRWGTGKTFLLKRWTQDLRNQSWQALYYNAWEDDFAGDPLLPITGRLSEHFEKTKLADRAHQIGGLIQPLLHFVASAATVAATGVPLPALPDGPQASSSSMTSYLQKRASTDKLKESLGELASEVRNETAQPLIFVIDELDRCRPTFAIELLERVKHIFDVPNITFVIGINREELTKSIESVYGKIDSSTYLRRFFDMEFVLPDADPTRFCRHLLERFRVPEHFQALSKSGSGGQRIEEFRMTVQYLSLLLGNMGLSLRDMDYCVRFLALTLRSLEGGYRLHPALLIALVALKVREPTMYRSFVEGNVRGAEVIDYLSSLTPAGVGGTEHQLINRRDNIELVQAAIYAADDAETVQTQLDRLKTVGQEPDRPEYLAKEHARLGSTDSTALSRLVAQAAEDAKQHGASLGYLAELIDLYSDFARPR